MNHCVISGRRVLLADGTIAEAAVECHDGCIREIREGESSQADFDAGDMLVLPGIIDLHGDAFERQIHPRPKSKMPLDIALVDTDRQMIANGICTAYHGLTVTWEPGTRDLGAARDLLGHMHQLRPRLQCDTRLHLRHEVLNLDTLEEEIEWIRGGRVDLLAINDHTHMIEKALVHPPSLIGRLDKLSVNGEEYRPLAERALSRRDEISASLQRLTSVARQCQIPLASHDDDTPEMRASYREMGCHMCEFPADSVTAEAAISAGDELILGGPNVLRGGSHCGRVTAVEMVQRGLCTAICSDYYYPSILLTPFRLAEAGVMPLAAAWNLVSSGPARAARLYDRGSIEPGLRADLLFVDDRDPWLPTVRAVFVKGAAVFLNGLISARATEPASHCAPVGEVVRTERR